MCGHRLQEEANKHHAVAAAAAQDASAVKRARFEASVDAAQLARFQATLGDGLLFGMVGFLAPRMPCSYEWHLEASQKWRMLARLSLWLNSKGPRRRKGNACLHDACLAGWS